MRIEWLIWLGNIFAFLKRHTEWNMRIEWLTWLCNIFANAMSASCNTLTAEKLNEYMQLTYLKCAEINYIVKKFSAMSDVAQLTQNLQQRFDAAQICEIFPALGNNPFVDRIFRVFSSQADGSLHLEEFLNLCSVFSERCPLKVKAAWAFLIYDFDEDNQITKSDIGEMLDRLTQPKMLTMLQKEHIANAILENMDLEHLGGINQVEFLHAMTKMPEFVQVFSFKL